MSLLQRLLSKYGQELRKLRPFYASTSAYEEHLIASLDKDNDLQATSEWLSNFKMG